MNNLRALVFSGISFFCTLCFCMEKSDIEKFQIKSAEITKIKSELFSMTLSGHLMPQKNLITSTLEICENTNAKFLKANWKLKEIQQFAHEFLIKSEADLSLIQAAISELKKSQLLYDLQKAQDAQKEDR